MPNAPVRRHPLFLRLLKPIEPIYPDAVTEVASDDLVEGVVYIVIRPCSKMRTWGKQLRKLHRADDSYKTDLRFSRLGAQPIKAANLLTIGEIERDVFNAGLTETDRADARLYLSMPLIAVALDRKGGHAVGFASFALKWSVDALAGAGDEIDFEVEPGQVWIDPSCRRRGLGQMTAIAIAMTAGRHVRQVEAKTHWPKHFTAKMRLTVCADVYSTTGEQFLNECAEFTSFEFDETDDPQRIELSNFECHVRW
jgi:hypothetical protein